MGSPALTISGSDPVLAPSPPLPPLPPKDTVLSLRTGKVRPFAGVKISSAINKQPRQGRVQLTSFGFVGDERDFFMHQGPDNAVHQYDPRHYEEWKKILPDRDHRFKIGAFGENISTRHLSETNLCIGDKFRLGPDAIIQVTMPRQPCYKLNHRFEYKKMSSLAQSTGNTGWLYCTIQDGLVQEGDDMELIERLNPTWSVRRVQHYLYKDGSNMEAIAEIIALPGLGQELVELLEQRLLAGAEDMSGRLQGDITVPWRSYKLVEKTPLTPRIQKFVFNAEDTDIEAEDLQFGRFPHVRVKFGPDKKYTRAYSVVSGDMKSFELGIAKDDNSRGGSLYLHDYMNIGHTLKVAKGHNAPKKQNDQYRFGTKRHIFILGGIGVTAFLSEIKTLVKESAQVETTVYARSEGQRLRVADVVPPASNSTDREAIIYCCGPTSLLEACRTHTKQLGYPKSHTHFEEFGGAATGTGDPFEAEIKATGKVLQIPGEKSLLQVLNEAGFDLDSSCLVGNCGSLMVNHCKGDIIHQGVALDDEQKETSMLSCVSRGKGRITVDC
ncbi:Uu.00g145990.m01.CDS01 [Anthostomella pinea]|uniref:Uu.00g145990.m01.CDS01 n=1 Tax=Anthostomella pinea TaxID=933095 RepID=A0AAI8YLS9_9PEZI|nr:Uu.00g145990.m01.CDS01 [Anthostomella pinea]